MATPAEFVRTCWPLALKAGSRYGISPLVVMMQAAVESAWGTSYSATTRRNYFGITVGSGQRNQYWSGAYSVSSVSGLKFRIYPSAQAGFYDFARLIREKYPTAAAVSSNPAKYAHAISYSPYISEANGDHRPTYERNLLSAAERIRAELGTWHPSSSTLAGVLAGAAFVAAGAYWQRRQLAPLVAAARRQLQLT